MGEGTSTSGALLRVVGAAGLLANGYVHFSEYRDGLDQVNKIGEAFLVNIVIAVVLAVATVVSRRALVAAGGVLFSLGTLAALLVARYGELLGYSEASWRDPAIVASVVEVATAVILGAYTIKQLATDRGKSGGADSSR